MLDLLHIKRLPHHDIQAAFFNHGKRQKMVHQTIHRCHNNSAFIFQQMLKNLHSLSCQKISVDIRAVKQKIPCRIQPDIRLKIAEIIEDLLRAGIVIGHNEPPRIVL